MSRYRIVSRTYPRDYWREHGDEILDTANELHNNRWSSREARHLCANGLRTRSLAATGASAEQMWIQALAFTLALMNVSVLVSQFSYRLGWEEASGGGSTVWSEALGLLAVVALTRSTRLAAIALTPAFFMTMMAQDGALNETESWVSLATLATLTLWIGLRGTGHPAIPLPFVAVLASVAVASVALDWNPFIMTFAVWFVIGLIVAPFEPRGLAVATVAGLPIVIVSLIFMIVDGLPVDNMFALIFGAFWLAAAILATFSNRRLRNAAQI